MPIPPIPFNRPCPAGKEADYLLKCLQGGHWSGDGPFTRAVQARFEARYGFRKVLLTPSCSDALEMAALLSGVGPGDEVIIPSYTFVSTANAFVLRGATPVFIDSQDRHPNLDANQLEGLITPRTKAIVVMHYGGVACDMERILDLAARYNLLVIEDAAHCVDARFNQTPLGKLGHLATFSFHETKNIVCGEGGALVINDPTFLQRAEIIREKGTNRAAFFRGEVDKYGWVDVGSSFLPSEFSAAVLLAQLEEVDAIQSRRLACWEGYRTALEGLAQRGDLLLPELPPYASQNAHVFYLVTRDLETRTRLLAHLKALGVGAVFHYQSLHQSTFFHDRHDGRPLPNADRFTDCLLRLPLFAGIRLDESKRVIEGVLAFFSGAGAPTSIQAGTP